jgi:glucose-6-phosphate isomerase
MRICDHHAWQALAGHAADIAHLHLRERLQDAERCAAMRVEEEGFVLDYSRQNAEPATLELLFRLAADGAGLHHRIEAMFAGEHINSTEDRAVGHVALRMPRGASFLVDGADVVPQIHEVLDRVRDFARAVRRGKRRGATGKRLRDVVAIGIGGSYLGPEFVYEALRTDRGAARRAKGRRLRFLANVDPIDVERALEGLDPARTLVVVVSKTFTTAETMLNARTVRDWLVRSLGDEAVSAQMVAISTNLKAVAEFGIDPANAFGFWDWVGGRYSVCSAVGILPLALHFGWKPVRAFLDGAHAMDVHFRSAPWPRNLPVLLGLLGVWNSSFQGHATRALLPYCQALLKFAPHIQQVDMESNGKRVTRDGEPLGFEAGEIDFGEPGTNGQHSFYQLIHQGRTVPCDFIGFRHSQRPARVAGHPVANHDELMANFFAQPDALACGLTAEELRAAGVPETLVPHKTFPGNRPSTVLLGEVCDPATVGRLLALYEHRTAVQGFIWGLNSFDQMGVELGKILAKRVASQLAASRGDGNAVSGFNPSTTALLESYLAR